MKNVGPVRKQLGVKTFFNMLGPMVNPSFPKFQMVGVFSLELARLYNYIYQQTDKEYAIIHSLDGYDEISLTGDFKVLTKDSENIYSPESLLFDKLKKSELSGGNSVKESAEIFTEIINGRGTEAQRNVVIANAAFAIKTMEKEKSLSDCINIAKESLRQEKH